MNPENYKTKKTYTITKLGKKILQDWLTKEPEPIPVRNELLLKVFFSWNLNPKIITNHILQYQDQIEKKLKEYQSLKFFVKAKMNNLTRMADING